MTTEINLDSDPLATGTHKGATGYVLNSYGADFKSCGVLIGKAIENSTTATVGTITAVTEHTVTSDVSFTSGDTYNIYRTATKDAEISRVYVDRRFGRKVLKRSELNNRGHFYDDEDLDANRDHVFGTGQPSRGHK